MGVGTPCGALLVDKPAGPTSHDVVAVVRRALRTGRIGHTGTLDPLATGLLVLLVGPATRLAQFVAADDKEYIADVRLGIATPTYDAASLPPSMGDVRGPMADMPTAAEIDAALEHFRGAFLQTPPPYSAKKVGGAVAHERARQERPLELAPVEVTVSSLERISDVDHRPSDIGQGGVVRLRLAASAGFYVRSLAHDLGQRLGCGAHLEALRRVRSGDFSVADAITLDVIVKEPAAAGRRLIPPGALLGGLPAATLNARGLVRALHGNALRPDHLTEPPKGAVSGAFIRLFDGPALVAVARAEEDGSLQPVVVLAGAPEVKY